MSNPFVSHVEEDAPIAMCFVAGLERVGFRTWTYSRAGSDQVGVSYLLVIRRAIEHSCAVIVVITRRALESPQVDKEIVRAHEAGKVIIPLLLGLTHDQLDRRRPEWTQAFGAATSLSIPMHEAAGAVPKLVEGLRRLGIKPERRPRGVKS